MSGPVVALVLAAGQGTRLGRGPKGVVGLGGRPLVTWSLDTLGECAAVDRVVVVGDKVAIRPALDRLKPEARAKVACIVPGGASREESCANGLEAVLDAAVVVVHDAARPFASGELFARVAAAAARTGAALAAVPLTDTLKRVAGDRVVETVPRAGLWRAQTPQAAQKLVLHRAHAEAREHRAAGTGDAAADDGALGTDDVALIERLGIPVELVPGEAWNVKITTPDDHAWAEAWIARGERSGGR